MELASKYNPADVEGKWYQYWLDHKLFSSKPDGREPYTVVIPPPNVTGVLHMGHMLNNTIQDILVRRARMEGKNACWVPGTDHASIATEAKVVNKLAAQGIKKTDLTRDEFLKHAWEWTDEHGGIILKQLRKLGASCDWDRTAFTMDEKRSESVLKVFVDLYNKGLIYRGVRMVNWDPKALTALSDEEVIYKEEHSKLYYLKYMVEGDPEGRYAVVATTRPETIMGDTAMCINPNDPKNTWLKGKKVIVPLVGRVIPVIEDDYVDIEFGTGCLKVTPAHDVNDYMLGEKYNLPSIDIFNDNGTLSEAAGLYIGMDRFDVREQIEKDLAAAGLLEKVEAYTNKVGFSERTNVPIEPKLSMQWFLKMQHFADMALPPVMNDELKFYPTKYKNTYKNWLENIKDWCISRQLWWGHRIPAYFLPEGGYVVAATPEEALALAKEKTGNADLKLEDLRQDEDCLDTWFSSWLWPISLFDGINNPGNEEINYYYPTSDLVTGPDIIFFWVARMMFMSMEFMKEIPFKYVFIHGLVRDSQGRKMSKSLGNGIDPLEVIEKYGADALRFTLVTGNTPGNDMRFYYERVEGNRNFANKLWNATKFTLMNLDDYDKDFVPTKEQLTLADKWILDRLAYTEDYVGTNLDKYELGEAADSIYNFAWNYFCDWYIETAKGRLYGQHNTDRKVTQYVLVYTLTRMLALLHPFMPFITEHLWQHLPHEGETLARAPWPKADEALRFPTEAEQFDRIMDCIKAVRNMRAEAGVPPNKACHIQIAVLRDDLKACLENNKEYFEKLGHVEGMKLLSADAAKPENANAAVVTGLEVCLELKGLIDTAKEKEKIQKAKDALAKDIARTSGKLSNQGFLAKAPEAVVAKEKEKLATFEEKMKSLDERLQFLEKLG